jgi:hypothetical protein
LAEVVVVEEEEEEVVVEVEVAVVAAFQGLILLQQPNQLVQSMH